MNGLATRRRPPIFLISIIRPSCAKPSRLCLGFTTKADDERPGTYVLSGDHTDEEKRTLLRRASTLHAARQRLRLALSTAIPMFRSGELLAR